MNCPQCQKPMTLVSPYWICSVHQPPVSVPDPILGEIDPLPSVLALPLREFAIETHPVMRLHRLCDAAEILTRLLTMPGARGGASKGRRQAVPRRSAS